jgi:hypothetical protein
MSSFPAAVATDCIRTVTFRTTRMNTQPAPELQESATHGAAETAPAATDNTPALGWVILRALSGYAGYVLRVFVTTHLVVDLGFGLLLAIPCYLIAANGSVLRGALTALLAFVLAVIVGCILSVQVSVSLSIARLVEQTQLGRRSLDVLLRATRRQDLLDTSLTLPVLGSLLHDAAATVRQDEVPRGGVSRLLAAVSRRVLRVVLRFVARQVLASAQRMCEPDGTVRLARVRDELSDIIDRQLVDAARARVRQWSLGLLCLCGIVALTAAWGIRQLPQWGAF